MPLRAAVLVARRNRILGPHNHTRPRGFVLAIIAKLIDAWTNITGRVIAHLLLVMIALTFGAALSRYFFGVSFAWLQELYVWCHAIVFLGCAAYALREEAHVRIDIFYGSFGKRGKSVVNCLGTLFLLTPWLGIIVYYSWSYVVASWQIGERSASSNGMPAVYVLKAMILVFAVLMGLQAVSLVIRSLMGFEARGDDKPAGGI